MTTTEDIVGRYIPMGYDINTNVLFEQCTFCEPLQETISVHFYNAFDPCIRANAGRKTFNPHSVREAKEAAYVVNIFGNTLGADVERFSSSRK